MKDLRKETVTTVVYALIAVRQRDVKAMRDAEQLGHLTYQATLRQALDDNAAALRDLNEDAAPWLQFHAQLRDVFPGAMNEQLQSNSEAV